MYCTLSSLSFLSQNKSVSWMPECSQTVLVWSVSSCQWIRSFRSIWLHLWTSSLPPSLLPSPPPVFPLTSFHLLPVYELNFLHPPKNACSVPLNLFLPLNLSPPKTTCIYRSTVSAVVWISKLWGVLYLCGEEGRGQGPWRQRWAVESNGDEVTSCQEEGGGGDFQAFGFSAFQRPVTGQSPPLRCCRALWPHSIPLTRWQVQRLSALIWVGSLCALAPPPPQCVGGALWRGGGAGGRASLLRRRPGGMGVVSRGRGWGGR